MESVEMMARRPSRQVNCSPEGEQAGGETTIREDTRVSFSAKTAISLIASAVAITIAAATAWYSTQGQISEQRAQTEALKAMVVTYIADSNRKWEQYSADREADRKSRDADREESRRWREELKDAIRSIQVR